jgi:formylglycine-generating enzyme required for sulfatase activity
VAAESPTNVTPVLGMVWIKRGTFIMGSPVSDPSSSGDERPQTVVTLTNGFWMGAHEVTQAEYLAVTGSNPSNFTGDTNRPVEEVSWTSAVAYCTTLTASERTAGRIPAGWGYRLPTEAEWEYCARAGARTTRFGYGDDLSFAALANYAWYSANSGGTTHPVEQKLANPWGLMDMHGNVWEWCQDFYGTYPGGSVTDPQGPGLFSRRVLRGGSWYFYGADYCRSAQRYNDDPGVASDDYGFRVVLSPGQP